MKMLLGKCQIMNVERSDVSAIADLHRRCVLESNSKCYPDTVISAWAGDISPECVDGQLNTTDWIKVVFEGVIVGFAQYSIGEGNIFQLQVDPMYQRKGVGRLLYEHIEKLFRNHGSPKISLFSTRNAVDFYSKLGFVKKGKTMYRAGKTEDIMVELEKMEKTLV